MYNTQEHVILSGQYIPVYEMEEANVCRCYAK